MQDSSQYSFNILSIFVSIFPQDSSQDSTAKCKSLSILVDLLKSLEKERITNFITSKRETPLQRTHLEPVIKARTPQLNYYSSVRGIALNLHTIKAPQIDRTMNPWAWKPSLLTSFMGPMTMVSHPVSYCLSHCMSYVSESMCHILYRTPYVSFCIKLCVKFCFKFCVSPYVHLVLHSMCPTVRLSPCVLFSTSLSVSLSISLNVNRFDWRSTPGKQLRIVQFALTGG